ncbi:non-ribosomal peptide synthetase [Micromonospora sp. DT48]|uniref:non-ribosomal peptide synthetase n=1 Tax=Micromonospora sp. DT48 TaxID=3393429 RepID=UPI003CED30CC
MAAIDPDQLTVEEKRALLIEGLRRRRQREFPASFPQQRMWFLDQLMPGNTSNNLPRAIRITGPLDIEAWSKAVNRIVERHEALRTTFRDEDGSPVQVVHPWLEPELVVEDHPELAAPDAWDAIQERAQREFNRAFDIETGPLLRLRFLRLTADDHILLVTIHHIAADLWSTTQFLTELAALYGEITGGPRAELPELPIQYSDYSQWQHRRMQEGAAAPDLDYWRQTLEGVPGGIDLPADRPRPPVQGIRGSTVLFELEPAMFDRLRAFCKDAGVTPFMATLAAFSVLLARVSRTDDVVVGVPTANRDRDEIKHLIGYFVNMLPMRVRIDPDADFRNLVQQVRSTALGAFAHQELSFEQIVDAVQPERDAARSPLFQVSFIYQNIDIPTFSAGGLSLEPLDIPSRTARFDLELQVFESAGLTGWFEYSTDLFDPPTIERLGRELTTLIAGLLDEPDKPVSAVNLLDPADLRQIEALGRGPRKDWGGSGLADDLVRQSAALRPDDVAVIGRGKLTYRELISEVDALAVRLQARGVGRGSLVGICLPRDERIIISLLAVLSCGAAYVPIDPAFPEARIRHTVEDSGLSLAIAVEETSGPLGGVAIELLDLPGSAPATDGGSVPRPVDGRNGGDTAYVIYTSGSTGVPKGVVVPHRALDNFLRSMAERPGMSAGEVLVAVTTFSFDISMLELLLPLSIGGTVVLAERDVVVDAVRLAALIDESGADLMQATPTTWRMLLDQGWRPAGSFRALVGGEALPPALATDLTAVVDETWNMYGPTETTIWSSVDRVGDGPVRLGEPIANTDLLVVEPSGLPAPIGVPGELWIGGSGVSLGYWQRPELTADRFVSRADGEGLWYRTGDLVRRDSNGELEFLGRLDHQVKLRGYRVELGEVEAALLADDTIVEAVAIVREDTPGDQRLVGYVRLADGAGPLDRAALQRRLADRLPEYMVPPVIVEQESFPLTANGKINRSALPRPGMVEREYVAPRSATEKVVAAIWEEVLGVDRIGVRDDFFALGGHSLLSTRVLVRVRTAFGVNVPLQRIFRDPTVAGLAVAVGELADSPETVERMAELILEMSDLGDDEVAAELRGEGDR